MAFRNNPTTTGTPANVPVGTVAVPNHANGDLTALRGANASTDGNGNETADVSTATPDGADITQGAQADAAWSGSGSGSLVALLKKVIAGQTGTATVVQSTGASQGTSWRVAGDYTELASLSAGALNADLVPSTDVSAYKWFSVQIATIATGGTISFQGSNDGVNFLNILCNQTSSSSGVFAATTTTGIYHGPVTFRYLRVRQTAWTSGSTTGTAELYSTVATPNVLNSNAGQTGTWTMQPGNTANTTPWLVSAGPPADLTLLASGAQTLTQTLADQANFAGKGIRVTLDVTVAGTGSITLEIDAKDPASGKYLALLTGAAVTTISTNVYVIHPELTAAANSIAKDVLPHTWRVKVTANNANSMTYSVGSSYLN